LIGASRNLPVQEPPSYGVPYQPGEETESGGGITIPQIWHMVLAHVWVSLGISVVALGVAFYLIRQMPKTYDATAQLIIDTNTSDPLANRGSIGQMGPLLQTQMELIYNPIILRPVIDRLKLRMDERFTGGFVGDERTLEDIIVGNLRNNLGVRQGNGTQLLYVSATARDPVQAADIANAVAEEFMRLTKERANAPALERAGRYDVQLAELKKRVEAAQDKLQSFRQRTGMTDLGRSGGDDAAMADLQAKLLQAQSTRKQLEDQRARGGALMGEEPEITALRTRLEALQAEMLKASATMGPRHPRILELQSEIETTRSAIQASAATRLATAQSQERKIQADLAVERNRIMGRSSLQDDGAKLVQELRLAEDAYTGALRGQDQVKFASTGDYQDVTLFSWAEPPVRANRSNKRKMFMMAGAGTLAFAFGLPFAYELFLNRRIRCRDDFERGLRIPVLAKFGPMKPAPTA
jgi:polysaccharide biosynthesis transport protein